jgi:hypothetical protein
MAGISVVATQRASAFRDVETKNLIIFLLFHH